MGPIPAPSSSVPGGPIPAPRSSSPFAAGVPSDPSGARRSSFSTDYGDAEAVAVPGVVSPASVLAKHQRRFEIGLVACLGVALLGVAFAGCQASGWAGQAATHTSQGLAKLEEANSEVLSDLAVAPPATAATPSRFAGALARRQEAVALIEQAQKDAQTSSKFAFAAVLCAAVLFLGGLGSVQSSARLKLGLWGLGALWLLISLIRIVFLPFA